MGTCVTKSKQALGFLTVLENPQHGLFGGYLVLNTSGRPLEFHCTAPIKPNRAQEILYGPTLQSFLYGEQIGQTLLSQGKHAPLLVCTDREPMLAVRELVSLPVALVLPADVEQSAADNLSAMTEGPTTPAEGEGKKFRIDAGHASGLRLHTFVLGRNRLAVSQRSDDARAITEQLADMLEAFDLAEPFGRICEAIEEAQQGTR